MSAPESSTPGSAAPGSSAFQCEALKVFVRGLEVQAEIGVHPHERGRAQPLVVDIELELAPLPANGPVVGIADTVNYEALAAKARALAQGGHIDLVETFAHRLATACLASARVRRARVRVDKPQAIQDAAAAGVEIVLSREN